MRSTDKFMSLPYDPALKARARELRKAGMLHEVLLWEKLKRRQLLGLDFDRQKVIGHYIVDFFCGERAVIVEIDGGSHVGKGNYDSDRQAYFEELGLTVIRVSAVAVLRSLGDVVEYLERHPALNGAQPERESSADED